MICKVLSNRFIRDKQLNWFIASILPESFVCFVTWITLKDLPPSKVKYFGINFFVDLSCFWILVFNNFTSRATPCYEEAWIVNGWKSTILFVLMPHEVITLWSHTKEIYDISMCQRNYFNVFIVSQKRNSLHIVWVIYFVIDTNYGFSDFINFNLSSLHKSIVIINEQPSLIRKTSCRISLIDIIIFVSLITKSVYPTWINLNCITYFTTLYLPDHLFFGIVNLDVSTCYYKTFHFFKVFLTHFIKLFFSKIRCFSLSTNNRSQVAFLCK